MDDNDKKKPSKACKHVVWYITPRGIKCGECKELLTTHFDLGREPKKLVKGFPNKVI